MRNNLIMHFHCSECGSRLDLSLDATTPKTDIWLDNSPKEPTGAECFYTPKISIVPCRFCIEKYTKPAKDLMLAISNLNPNHLSE